MVSVKVEIFKSSLDYDRYHIMPINHNDPSDQDVLYTEQGNAFNGFYAPLILDVSYDVIKNSKMLRITLDGINNNNPLYGLISEIRYLRSDKTAVYYELDSWMNYRTSFDISYQNKIYQTTADIDYPFIARSGSFKKITLKYKMFEPTDYHVIILYHDQQNNSEGVYYCVCSNWYDIYFIFGQITPIDGFDSNNVLGIWLSPFDLNECIPTVFNNQSIVSTTGLTIYKGAYSSLTRYFITHSKQVTVSITNNDIVQDCVLDMTGSIVWKSEFKDNGSRYFMSCLDLDYDQCVWNCFIGTGNVLTDQNSPNNRFGISCLSIGFLADYYQEYENLSKSFNKELRQAQLEKQLIDGIGNVATSTVNMGVVGGMSGNVGSGAVAGGIGSAVSLAVGQFSTIDYNNKMESIENRQARMQYDIKMGSSENLLNFLIGCSKPCIATISCDDESIRSYEIDTNTRIKNYNCGIKRTDLINLLNAHPLFISGDFDFIDIPNSDIKQLKERFAHGVNFIL